MSKFNQYFALAVFRDKLILPADYKALLVQRIFEMEAQSGQPAKPNTAWLGDTRGAEFLFRHPDFTRLYREIAGKIREYLEGLGIDHDKLSLYYQRSWATVTRRQQRIHEHAHVQSNITFAYYLRKPPGSGGVYFTIENHPNEISPGLFSPSKASLGLIKQPGMMTWNSVLVQTEEDDIVIFPSKTVHGTVPSDSIEPRISISADISMMLRDSTGHETLMPHFSNWKGFDEIEATE